MRAGDPDGALRESAALAMELAPRSCGANPVTGQPCAWYHGTWQALRLLGLVAGPDLDEPFLGQALRELAGAGHRPRILICAAADYALAAHVFAALPANDPQVTVIDACDTPLHFNRWYAERMSLHVETRKVDLFSYSPEDAFDVILAHSLLGHIPLARRPGLARKWRDWLRPSGGVIAVNRLRRAPDSPQTGFDEPQVQAFRAAALERLRALDPPVPIEPRRLAETAEAYARVRRPHVVRSEAELAELLAAQGMQIERSELFTASADRSAGGIGPGAGGPRLRLIARRREFLARSPK